MGMPREEQEEEKKEVELIEGHVCDVVDRERRQERLRDDFRGYFSLYTVFQHNGMHLHVVNMHDQSREVTAAFRHRVRLPGGIRDDFNNAALCDGTLFLVAD